MTPSIRSRAAAVAVATLMMLLVQAAILSGSDAELFDDQWPNPDSYYKLVTLMERTPQHGFRHVARDNAPHGNWIHWSMPHACSVGWLRDGLRYIGIPERPALRYAGSGLTLISLLLLGLFVALAVSQFGSRNAVMLSGLLTATSIPLLSYGRFDQITHHIFMLVPLAAAAACLLRPAGAGRATVDGIGGLLLGLALWISPETMPFVVGLVYLRIAMRLQGLGQGPLWPLTVTLPVAVLLAWRLDPPPPTFDAWALDHVSLAYLLLAVLLGANLLLAERCRQRGWPMSRSLPVCVLASVACAAAWLTIVPGALSGPAGLLPDELKRLFWDQVSELKPVQRPSEYLGFLLLPFGGALLCAFAAWRRRSLWLLALALMSLAYGVLAAAHVRMGAAAALAAILAVCAGASALPAFADESPGGLSRRQHLGGLAISLWPVLQLGLFAVLAVLWPTPPRDEHRSLRSVAPFLQQIPPATILTDLYSGPELLYRTRHRVIAGPYHHNVQGMLDNFHAWLDTGEDVAASIVRKRGIDYVLAYGSVRDLLKGKHGKRTLAQRAAAGDVPDWLHPVPWPADTDSEWHLYRVDPARLPAARAEEAH